MKRERIVVMAAAACLSFGSVMTGAVMDARVAQAMPNSSGHDFIYPKGVCTNEACANQWCPGMPLPCGADCTGHPRYPNWDMGVCHDFMVGYKTPDSKPWFQGTTQVAPGILEGDPGWGPGPCNGQPICLPGL